MISRFPFLQPFVRRPLLVLVPVILLCSAGVLYLRTAERRFRSSAQLLVIQKGPALSEGSRDTAMERSIESEILGTHMQILSSPRVIRAAIERDQLTELSSLVTQARRPIGLKGMLQAPPVVDGELTDEDVGHAISYIRRNLGVRRGGSDAARDAQVVEVTFEHYASGDDCATILKSIVASYRIFLRDIADRLGEETKVAVTEASRKMYNVVLENEAKREAFLNSSPLVWHNGLTSNPHQQQLAQLEAERSTLKIRLASLGARLERIRGLLKDTDVRPIELFAWIDQQDIERLSQSLDVGRGGLPVSLANQYGELVKLKVELARKSAIYTPDHSSVQQLNKTVEELQGYLSAHTEVMGSFGGEQGVSPSEIATAYSHLLEQEMADLQCQLDAASDLVLAEQERAKALSGFEIEYDRVNRQLERSNELYESLIQRLRQLELTGDLDGFLTEEITPVEPGYQVWPNAKFILAVFGVLGISLGGGLALLAEFADESFRDKLDLEAALGIPLIAEVPSKRFSRKRKQYSKSDIAPSVATHHAPETPYAASFRSLRTAIAFRTGQKDNLVLQFISGATGEGKSVVVANLAVSMARSGKRVLLIEGDLRNPTLHSLFGVSNEIGVTSITAGEAVDSVTIATEVPNLDIVPAGPFSWEGDEIYEHVIREFLDRIRNEYDVVLVDSSPVSDTSVSLAVAGAVDFTLLVVRLNSRSRSVASYATRQLVSHGANLMGVVANGELQQVSHYQPALRIVREHHDQARHPVEKVAS